MRGLVHVDQTGVTTLPLNQGRGLGCSVAWALRHDDRESGNPKAGDTRRVALEHQRPPRLAAALRREFVSCEARDVPDSSSAQRAHLSGRAELPMRSSPSRSPASRCCPLRRLDEADAPDRRSLDVHEERVDPTPRARRPQTRPAPRRPRPPVPAHQVARRARDLRTPGPPSPAPRGCARHRRWRSAPPQVGDGGPRCEAERSTPLHAPRPRRLRSAAGGLLRGAHRAPSRPSRAERAPRRPAPGRRATPEGAVQRSEPEESRAL